VTDKEGGVGKIMKKGQTCGGKQKKISIKSSHDQVRLEGKTKTGPLWRVRGSGCQETVQTNEKRGGGNAKKNGTTFEQKVKPIGNPQTQFQFNGGNKKQM